MRSFSVFSAFSFSKLSKQTILTAQENLFQIRSQTNALPANRGDPQQCPTGCGRILDNPHIVQCPAINTHIGDYSLILNGTLQEKKSMLKHFKVSLKKIDTIDSTDSILDC